MSEIYILKNSDLETIPFSNLKLEFTYDKAAIASFNSNYNLQKGSEIKIFGENHPSFGGIIYEQEYNTNDAFFSYESIDYTSLLFEKINFSTPRGLTSHKIIKKIIKNNQVSISGVQKTPHHHPSLTFKEKSIWEIIQTLRWLDHKNNEKYIAYVDHDGVLNYKKYDDKSYHVFENIYNYKQNYVQDEEELFKDFFKQYKNIYHEKRTQKKNQIKKKTLNSSKPIETKKVIDKLKKTLTSKKGYKWSESSDYKSIISKKEGNSEAMSEYIYNELKSYGIIVRIIKKDTYQVQYKLQTNKKWLNFPYSKDLDERFKNIITKGETIKSTLLPKKIIKKQ